MPAPVAILHGWSDTSKSFQNLRDFLRGNGYEAAQIWLGDYVSKDDDVRVEDVAKRMDSVVGELLADRTLRQPFDLIVHSTGGLVAREWVMRCQAEGRACPVKRLVMLAPANFGSSLAALGKSMIGRVSKGWNNWLETGKQMLSELELASRYQWDLARRDLFDAGGAAAGGPYGAAKIWPFIIVGTSGYPSGLRQIVNEFGADGTVRCCAANLNAVGMTVDFTSNAKTPDVAPWHWRAGELTFPFVILPDRNHSSIHEPATASGAAPVISEQLGRLILAALRCATLQQYTALAQQWEILNEATYRLSQDPQELARAFPREPPDPRSFHQYLQVVAFVRDDQGEPVDDYFLEFFAPEKTDNEEAVYFQRQVLEDTHVNDQFASRRCLFIDRTDLMLNYYQLPSIRNVAKQLAVSLSAAPPGKNVRYFDSTREGAKGELIVHTENEATRAGLKGRLYRNRTHLMEIIIPRQPVANLFKLER